MKRWLAVIGILIVTFLVAGLAVAHAQTFSATVNKGQTVNSSLFAGSNDVTIAGTVNGDVYCGGSSVTITGTVNGDVICAGQTLDIAGTVNGNVRAAAQNLTITGTVTERVTLAGTTVHLAGNSRIGSDAVLAGTSVRLDGTIGRDAVIGATNVTVNGLVDRNVKVASQNLHLLSGAHVKGNLDYTSNNVVDRQSGSQVNGTVHHTQPAKHQQNWGGRIVGWFYLLLAGLLYVLVLVILFPQVFHRAAAHPAKRLGLTLLVGLVTAFVWPIIFIALLITVLGIPLALLFLLAMILLIAVSGPVAAYYLGSMLLRNSRHAVAIMMLGAVVLIILCLIPFVGIFVGLVAYWLGLGAVMLEAKELFRRPVYKVD